MSGRRGRRVSFSVFQSLEEHPGVIVRLEDQRT